MDPQRYCHYLEDQLAAVNARLKEVMRDAEQRGREWTGRSDSLTGRLRSALAEIESRFAELKAACPVEDSGDLRLPDGGLRELQLVLGRLSESVRGALLPDTLAWVSP
jgi:hypothetical protein